MIVKKSSYMYMVALSKSEPIFLILKRPYAIFHQGRIIFAIFITKCVHRITCIIDGYNKYRVYLIRQTGLSVICLSFIMLGNAQLNLTYHLQTSSNSNHLRVLYIYPSSPLSLPIRLSCNL